MKALAADEISAGSNQAGMGLWIRWSCHEIIDNQSLYQRQAGSERLSGAAPVTPEILLAA
jgi:hypothetical protein